MPYQQRLRGREIALVILEAGTMNLDDLLALVPDVLRALDGLKPGNVVRIGNG
jgi:hypothetical protein